MTVDTAHAWADNAHLIADVAALGFLRPDDVVLDVTFGRGRFWTQYRPEHLIALDGNPKKALDAVADFRSLPFPDRAVDVVVFDPPYKLNGTPNRGGPASSDADYGVEEPTRWQDRLALIADGFEECARVASRSVLAKCQDQVSSGQIRWQVDLLTNRARDLGYRKAAVFHLLGGTEQPPRDRKCPRCKGRRVVGEPGWYDPCPECAGVGRVPSPQVHPKANFSTLAVFVRSKSARSTAEVVAGVIRDAYGTEEPGLVESIARALKERP